MSGRFQFQECPLSGLYRVKRLPIKDTRGFFSRFFCAEEFKALGFRQPIAQMNHTLTVKKGAVRGMHFQHPPHSEVKIVNCLQGEVFDVVVDIRKGSPTFLKWHGEILSAENQTGLYIPEGFAHGFQALTNNCEMMYLHSTFYAPNAEGGLNVTDPALDISWPLAFTEYSERDQNHPMTDSSFTGVMVS